MSKLAAIRVQTQDTVGAGDAFAAAFIHGLSLQWPPAEIADFANRVAALVASRPGGTPAWTLEEVRALQVGARCRAQGGASQLIQHFLQFRQ